MAKSKSPPHLTPATAEWYAAILNDYVLEDHHRLLLQAAAEAWDRMQQARQVLAVEGITFEDRHKVKRPHPCVAIERDSRTAFARMIRELGLDIESPAEVKPPTIAPNSRRA